ncbi:MAG: hypothetical protein WCC01_03825 [Acidimicrobiia bacterium]
MKSNSTSPTNANVDIATADAFKALADTRALAEETNDRVSDVMSEAVAEVEAAVLARWCEYHGHPEWFEEWINRTIEEVFPPSASDWFALMSERLDT